MIALMVVHNQWDIFALGKLRCRANARTNRAETVPNFVPTTKPHRVLLSFVAPLESLVARGICDTPWQVVVLCATR